MSLKVWIDGKFYDKSDARISVYDHGLLYGDGVFEGIRAYSGKVFEGPAHVRRLYNSAKAIRLTIPMPEQQFLSVIEETVRINNFQDCYIRAVATRGVGYLGLNPNKCPTPSVFVIADTIELFPRDLYEVGISVITSSVVRNHPNALPPRVKSLNYLNNILAKIEAIDAGVMEAVVLNHDGNVAEGTADNIFIVKDGVVLTPRPTDGILEGITRAVIMRLAGKMNIPCHELTLQRHDLYIADECFLTGTGAEVIPVIKIDGREVGNGRPGVITKKLLDAFHRHVREA